MSKYSVQQMKCIQSDCQGLSVQSLVGHNVKELVWQYNFCLKKFLSSLV